LAVKSGNFTGETAGLPAWVHLAKYTPIPILPERLAKQAWMGVALDPL